mmetsp:Transcript_14803/g.20613  ORF Transcript_14803/g.20613 Transcript_14803/m.20613 type:complete len:84 (+) Transcript_14803:809-1060(+)
MEATSIIALCLAVFAFQGDIVCVDYCIDVLSIDVLIISGSDKQSSWEIGDSCHSSWLLTDDDHLDDKAAYTLVSLCILGLALR